MKALLLSGSPRKHGNTARILDRIEQGLQERGYHTKRYAVSDADIKFCRGDKTCNKTGECIHNDDVSTIVSEMFDSQLVVVSSPSYWGDVTAQLKTFIDRCTPYCDTNPGRKLSARGTKGIAVAVRAGKNKAENENLVHTIEHFMGHLGIPVIASFTVEGIDTSEDLEQRPDVLEKAYLFGKKITVGELEP